MNEDSLVEVEKLPMLDDELYLHSKYVRMMHQYFLAPIGILDYKGYENYITLIEKYGAPISRIKELIETGDDCDVVNKLTESESDCKLLAWFDPYNLYHMLPSGIKLNDEEVIDAMWKVPPHRLPNFFRSIQWYYKIHLAIGRIGVLRALYQINKADNELPVIVDLGFGLKSVIKPVNKKYNTHDIASTPTPFLVLFFGCTYLFDDIKKNDQDEILHYYKFMLEKHISSNMVQACKLYVKCAFKELKEVPSFERNTHSLSQLSKSMVTGMSTLLNKAEICFQVFSDFQRLIEHHIDKIDDFRGAEWRKILKTLLFVRLYVSEERNKICKVCSIERSEANTNLSNYIEHHANTLQEIKNRLVMLQSSSGIRKYFNKDQEAILASVLSKIDNLNALDLNYTCSESSLCASKEMTICFSLYPENEHILSATVPFCMPTFYENEDLKPIRFEFNSGVEGKETAEPLSINVSPTCIYSEQLVKSLTNHYYWFNDEYNSNEYCTDWQYLDRIRHIMQRLSHSEIHKLLKNGAKWAMDIAGAHNALIVLFDGEKDFIDIDNFTSEMQFNRQLHKRGTEKIEVKARNYKKRIMDEFVRIWKKEQGDIGLIKQQSSILRTLTPDIVSRFNTRDTNRNISCFSPYATEILSTPIQRLKSIPIEDNDEWDIISVPLMFHGRRQGVLHLNSCYKSQFTYENRMSIVTFKRVFEEELFEFRQSVFLNSINDKLGSILKSGNNEQGFFDTIAKSYSHLYGANGSLICRFKDGKYSVEGCSGSDVSLSFTNATIEISSSILSKISTNDPYILRVSELDDDYHKSQLTQMSILELIVVPFSQITGERELGSPVDGFMVLFDKTLSNHFSSALMQDLKYVTGEIWQAVKHYYDHKEKITFSDSRLAHNVLVFLAGIEASTKSIEEYSSYFKNHDRRDDFLKNVFDIRMFSTSARDLLKIIRKQLEIPKVGNETGNMLAVYQTYKDENGVPSEPVPLYSCLLSSLHNIMKNRSVRLSSQDGLYHKVSIDIPELKLIDVFGNLIGNMRKYALSNLPASIFVYDNTPFGIVIEFDNFSIPLNDELAKKTDQLFDYGIRGRPLDDTDGEGIGLYVAKELAKSWGGNIELEYKKIANYEAMYKFRVSIPEYRIIRNEVNNEDQ